ncbi:unnamed protein product [Phaedon cochleariae]|uniref:Uncharacterized protein n=1 Tax=Phaedon cochleariae TaxID=80249 RepID=A0A9P0DMZ0_PHACE|nr:unnamed protein product [Phaedon cochleariae]
MTSEMGDKEPSNLSPKTSSQNISVAEDIEHEELEECTSQYLLSKNTSSFRCLAQVLLSNSSLMKNRLYLFPPLVDPGIDEAFYYSKPEPVYDDVGVEKYLNICRELEIVPLSRIIKSLDGDTMNLKYYGLTVKQFRAVTEALKGNEYIEHLILEENFLNLEMTVMLCSMIEENSTLRNLNLRGCRIGEVGAKLLSEALLSSQFLTELDLSFNEFGDVGLKNLQQGLCDTSSLKKLNISHNNLTEDSGETLERILLDNKSLTNIDLSWNGFYTGPGNKKLFNGFKQNDQITVLNLAWNGISIKPAIAPVAKYIKASTALEYLDLSSNRLSGKPLRMIRAAILKNQSLITVRIGNNPYPPDEAFYVASVLTSKPKDHPLKYLDMENILFNKEIVPLLARIRNSGKTIKIGGILSNYIIKGPDVAKLIFERCRYLLTKPKKKKAKRDFGHFILSLPENPITRQEFDTLLKKKKIKKLDKDLINGLTDKFPMKKKIDCGGMVAAYMNLYPETCLPPVKVSAKKGKGKNKKKKVEENIEELENEIKVHDLEPAKSLQNTVVTSNVSEKKIQSQLRFSSNPVATELNE